MTRRLRGSSWPGNRKVSGAALVEAGGRGALRLERPGQFGLLTAARGEQREEVMSVLKRAAAVRYKELDTPWTDVRTGYSSTISRSCV